MSAKNLSSVSGVRRAMGVCSPVCERAFTLRLSSELISTAASSRPHASLLTNTTPALGNARTSALCCDVKVSLSKWT